MTIMTDRPKTIRASSGGSFEELCRLLPELRVPDGYRAEIIGGKIVVWPWSERYHLPIMRLLRRELEPHAPQGHLADYAPYLFTFPASERSYAPDVYVVDEAAFHARGRYVPGDALSLVAELTSASTRDNDWGDKLKMYAQNGVPVYLLLDMQEETTTVFWTPSQNGYVSHLTLPFGEKVHIPAPFDCDIDTSAFAIPEDADEDEQ